MPYVRIWIHAVWSTKLRAPSLEKNIREKVFDHMRSNARKKKIVLDCINGYDDHVHCLIGLKNTQSISSIIHLIKGESSHWINQENLCDHFFAWQREYWAASVCEDHMEKLRRYIANQEHHHNRQLEEYLSSLPQN
jgi:REP element-mobilizing transposase RayT